MSLQISLDVATEEWKFNQLGEGTEAAAVASVEIQTLFASAPPPFQMAVDRPFFYAIRDNQTGTVLFMGTVVEPE